MNKKLNELTDVIANTHPFYVETVAQSVYDNHYRKEIWHKISEGDLPKVSRKNNYEKDVLCRTRNGKTLVLTYRKLSGCYEFGIYKTIFNFFGQSRDSVTLFDVIAWMEIPEYEE